LTIINEWITISQLVDEIQLELIKKTWNERMKEFNESNFVTPYDHHKAIRNARDERLSEDKPYAD
jgi:hypothetical protein